MSKKTDKDVKKSQVEEVNPEVVDDDEADSPWYYFYSQGCGWCKRVDPIVDTLISEGYDILKLDLADGNNKKLQDEVKKEYKHQCGTPYFVNSETGNSICGFREKDVLEKWAKGEEIPQPVRPTGPPPKPPLHGASEEDEGKWKKEYNEWYKKNDKLPNVKTAEELLKLPRPKSDPPKPPTPTATDEELEKWKKEYDVWSKENSHLPNMIPSDTIVERFKPRRDAQGNQSAMQGGAKLSPDQEARLTRVEQKLDKLIKHLGVK